MPCYRKMKPSASKASSPQLKNLGLSSLFREYSLSKLLPFFNWQLLLEPLCVSVFLARQRKALPAYYRPLAPPHLLHGHSRTVTVESTRVAKKDTAAQKPTAQPGARVKALRVTSLHSLSH